MISDRQLQVSLTKLLAWAFWCVAGVLIGFGVMDRFDSLTQVGLGFSAAAATVHMRSFVCEFSCRLKDAFEMGREVEREKQSTLHSVG